MNELEHLQQQNERLRGLLGETADVLDVTLEAVEGILAALPQPVSVPSLKAAREICRKIKYEIVK
jgi:hypothetical protein